MFTLRVNESLEDEDGLGGGVLVIEGPNGMRDEIACTMVEVVHFVHGMQDLSLGQVIRMGGAEAWPVINKPIEGVIERGKLNVAETLIGKLTHAAHGTTIEIETISEELKSNRMFYRPLHIAVMQAVKNRLSKLQQAA